MPPKGRIIEADAGKAAKTATPLLVNAFDSLMSPKRSRTSPERTSKRTQRTVFINSRDELGAYTADPESFPPSRVVDIDDKFVVIRDMFPKSTVHLLILPRDKYLKRKMPHDAFDDAQFLADCQKKERVVRRMVALELHRKFGRRFSATDRPLIEALDADEPPEKLPSGRDWEKEVISGIHANPSMNDLHIHVLSRDMVSGYVSRSNSYLSFTTDFLVSLDQFPLSPTDHRRQYGSMPKDLICWRCGENFGNKMAKLKVHLDAELDAWKRE